METTVNKKVIDFVWDTKKIENFRKSLSDRDFEEAIELCNNCEEGNCNECELF